MHGINRLSYFPKFTLIELQMDAFIQGRILPHLEGVHYYGAFSGKVLKFEALNAISCILSTTFIR